MTDISLLRMLRVATEDEQPVINKELCRAIKHLLCREMFTDEDNGFSGRAAARIFMYACLIDKPAWVALMLAYGWDFEQLLPADEESQWTGDLRNVPLAFAAYKNLNICQMLLDVGACPGENPLLIHHAQAGIQPILYKSYTLMHDTYARKLTPAQCEEWLFTAIGIQDARAVSAIANIARIDVNAPYQTSSISPVDQSMYMLITAGQDAAAKAKAQEVMAALAALGGEYD